LAIRALVFSYRAGAALLTLATIAYQYWVIVQHHASTVNFFSYFTVESNLLGAFVLLTFAVVRQPSLAAELVRGAAVAYLVVVALVVGFLLSNVELGLTAAWVDTVLHRVTPAVAILDWLVFPPRMRLPLRRTLLWLAYPLAYVVYSSVRGALAHWYPYPFLDPAKVGGAVGVAAYSVGIAVAMVILILLMTALTRLRAVARAG
jgi:hypothetical protein